MGLTQRPALFEPQHAISNNVLHVSATSKVIRLQRSGIDTIKYHTWPRIPMGKWQTHRRHHKREPKGQPFLSRWPQSTYKQTRTKHSQHKTEQKHKKIHKRSTALERSVKYFTGGLKPVLRRQPHPWFWCGPGHKASDQSAHTRSLIRAFASRLNILWVLSFWPNIIWCF